jgi:adenylate cyclase
MTLPQDVSTVPERNAPEIVALHLARPAEAEPPVAPIHRPDEQQIRAELERILASETFDASLRNRAFLRYVVDQTLAGHADYIKGYSVAQEVFQRDVNFDPQLDPVVRIEARRLRRSLELYYLTAGRRDFVRIEVPKGGYVPTFTFNRWDPRQAAANALRGAPDAPDAAVPPNPPMIIVRRFENCGDPRQDGWVRPHPEELGGRLLSYEGVQVAAEATGAPLSQVGCDERSDGGAPAAFLLTGSLRLSAGRLRAWAQLLDAASGRYLWVRAYDLTFGAPDRWDLQEEVAKAIAEMIAGPAGALAKLLRQG